ncbi:MAG: DUF3108 domain-containing protein [Candidatus Omnitrophica bacterium]|nr:DUF3108 domain-containing protein [Candidatus Omnitrophota bacterium]
MKKTIKNTFLILFFVFACLQIENAGCQATEKQNKNVVFPQNAIYSPVNVFNSGELIKFGVYSAGIRVGSGELHYKGLVEEGTRKVQHVIFKVTTFSVNDEDNVFGTLDFASPVRVERKIRILGKDETIFESYAENKRSVTISKSVDDKKSESQVINTKDGMNNVLLLLYKLRNDKELKPGKSYKITLPTQNFELLVKSMRKIKTSLGVFNAYYLESNPPKYRIWLSPEPDRLPLRIQGLVAGGMLYLVATEVTRGNPAGLPIQ